MYMKIAVLWDVTPCSLLTLQSIMLPPSPG